MTTQNGKDSRNPRIVISNVQIDAIDIDEAVRVVVMEQTVGSVHLCNAYTLSIAARNSAFAATLNRAALNLADGMPIVWIAKFLGITSLSSRVYGPDLMLKSLDVGQNYRRRHFLFGSTTQTLDLLEKSIDDRFPKAQVVGKLAPPFSSLDNWDLGAAIESFSRANAEIVWVGTGTPKQDYLVDQFFALDPTRTYVAVGAAFDFLSGQKSQAPMLLQRAGLEWLFRLVQEPRRLWSRYLIGIPLFIWSVVSKPPRRIDLTQSQSPPADENSNDK